MKIVNSFVAASLLASGGALAVSAAPTASAATHGACSGGYKNIGSADKWSTGWKDYKEQWADRALREFGNGMLGGTVMGVTVDKEQIRYGTRYVHTWTCYQKQWHDVNSTYAITQLRGLMTLHIFFVGVKSNWYTLTPEITKQTSSKRS